MENLIDVNDAMVRLGGNKKLYVALLKKFNGEAMLEDLINKLKNGDSAAAAAQAHTIKGLAANLSLKDLKLKAESIELKIKGGEKNIDTSEIEQSLNQTVGAVNEWIEQNK
ncbi:MAG: Hpt domain-containing protein [Oscillospiraceae bacterium]|nr:Hpt domain-containing protein [Oscillospiraceae bacterium]